MSKTLDRLLKSNGLFCVDFRTGSPRDIVGNLTATVTGEPIITAGTGLVSRPYPPKDCVGYGNYHNITDTTKPYTWIIRGRCMLNTPSYLFEKTTSSGTTSWSIKCDPSITRWQLYLVNTWGVNDYMSIDVISPQVRPGVWSTFICTYDGSRIGAGMKGYVNGNYIGYGNGAVPATILPNTSPISILSQYNGINVGAGQVQIAALLNGVLTDTEIAAISEELRQETTPGLLDSPKRNFFFPYKTLSPEQATTQGLVLDTDFVRSSDGKVRNLAPTSYTGTLAGNPVPAGDGNGIKTDGVDDWVNFGDVTGLNSATKVTMSAWIKQNTVVTNSGLFMKSNTSSFRLGIANAATSGWYGFIATSGGNFYGQTPFVTNPSNIWQHYTYVFDGTGATNADRLKIFIDGTQLSLTFPGGDIPSVTGNGTGTSLVVGGEGTGGGRCSNINVRSFRVRTIALTAAQVRAEYLEGAKQILVDGRLRSDGSCPVTLSPITTKNTPVTGLWRTNDATQSNIRIVEENRERAIACSGQIVTPQTNAYGSWYWEWNGNSMIWVMPIASHPVAYNAAPNNGYLIYADGNGFQAGKSTNGSFAGWGEGTIAGSYLNKRIRFWMTRTTSGLFTVYIKNSAGPWTQLFQKSDTTHTTSTFSVHTSNSLSSRFYGLMHFAGAMTPAEAIGLGLIDP